MIWRALFFLVFSMSLAQPGHAEVVTFHRAPQPLPAGAVVEDWPRFLGPQEQPISGETKLLPAMPEAGLSVIWEREIGAGYASPSIVGDRLVFFHRLHEQEQILCCEAETGKPLWSHEYAVVYTDRYGYGAGPRGSAVIAGEQVFTFGVTSQLLALDLATGRVLWQHDCAAEFGVPQYFFGSGSSPLVMGGVVIVTLGGSEERSVVAFDRVSGAVRWTTKHAWGQSYASPVPGQMRGKDRVLVFAGGEGKPSTGGLLSIDPETGKVEAEHFWRASRYTSVNASSPCRCGPDRVFVSQAYVDSESPCNGGVMLEMSAEHQWQVRWKAPAFGCHWMTPVFHAGHLYAFSGEKENTCELVCHDAATGQRLWKQAPNWEQKLGEKTVPVGFKRGSLLHVDGRFLCLGEWGTLAWLDLSPTGMKVTSRTQPFLSQQSWTLPVVSHGLLYLCQHEKDELTGAPPRLLCYDFRAPGAP